MADLIVFTTARRKIRENSQFAVSARFRNRATGDATPTNIKYRLECLSTGALIKDWTSVTPANPVTITITPTENKMQDDCHPREVKQLAVAADYGLATQFVEVFEYRVENVAAVV